MHVTYPLGLGFEHSQGNAISMLFTKSQVLNYLGILMPGRFLDKLTLWPNKGFSKNHCWPDIDHDETSGKADGDSESCCAYKLLCSIE